MRLSDFVTVRRVATVVEHGEVADLRALLQDEDAALTDATRRRLEALTAEYVVADAHNRVAIETLLRALGGSRGSGFFVNGVFGSGKSHLLALLGLLAESNPARVAFLAAHDEFTGAVGALAARKPLVVTLSLEEFAPTHALEEIFWRATRAEAVRQRVELKPFAADASRVEQFAAFEQALHAAGRTGALWLLDELSMFLGARGHHGLTADASFLQFIGQRLGRGPFWLIAALQKSVDDIGALDPYALAQIRDRFHTRLMLTLAHVPTVIARRIVGRVPDSELPVDKIIERLQLRLPRLEFGPDDLRATFPFHPATLALLEAVAGRFFSRTRSALRFAQDVLTNDRLTAPLERLITPDELFDYFAPDLTAHPELRALHEQVFAYYERSVRELAPHDPALALRLVKLLIVGKVAGVNPTVAQAANWLLADGGVIGDDTYVYVQVLLDSFRARGAFVAVERREGEFADRYTIDLGARVNELLRRRLANVTFEFEEGDPRIVAAAFGCCTASDWPLAAASLDREVWWLNSPRQVLVERRDLRTLRSDEARHRLDLLATSSDHDLELWLAPFAAQRAQREQWLRAMSASAAASAAASTAVGDGPGLVALLPRAPTHGEWTRLREFGAAERLLQDPELRDNRRGRALLERLATDRPQREAEVRRIVQQLCLEGDVLVGGQAALRVGELIPETATLDQLLGEVAERVLPQRFSEFASIAPRMRLPSVSACDGVALELLRVRDDAAWPLASERVARALLAPLGLVAEKTGALRVTPLCAALRSAVLTRTRAEESVALRALEVELRKSSFGLPPELTRVAVLALLREGELVAEDVNGAPVALDRLRAPLRDSLVAIRRGRLLPKRTWELVVAALGAFCKFAPRQHTLGQQRAAHELLRRWRDDTSAEAELSQARLAQLRPLSPAAVERAQEFLRNWAEALNAVEATSNPADALERTALAWQRLFGGSLVKPLQVFVHEAAELHAALEVCQRLALDLYAYLTTPDFIADDSLAALRTEALALLRGEGELGAQLKAFVRAAEECRQRYLAAYVQWHEQAHAPDDSLSRAAELPALRLTAQIVKLTFRPFPRAAKAVQRLATAQFSLCRQPALAQQLQLRPTCPRCQLRFGVQPKRITLAELLTDANAAVEEFVDWLKQDEVGQECPTHGTDELLDWLTDATVVRLNDRFAPIRNVRRSLATLRDQLLGQRLTRAQAMEAFARWLDAGQPLRETDEVTFDQ